MEAYESIKEEIHKNKEFLKNEEQGMREKNELSHKRNKKDLLNLKQSYFNSINKYKIKGFNRAFTNVKNILGAQQFTIHSKPKHTKIVYFNTKEIVYEKNKDKSRNNDGKNIDCVNKENNTSMPKKNYIVPDIKLRINNVFSRLYKNVVFPMSYGKGKINNITKYFKYADVINERKLKWKYKMKLNNFKPIDNKYKTTLTEPSYKQHIEKKLLQISASKSKRKQIGKNKKRDIFKEEEAQIKMKNKIKFSLENTLTDNNGKEFTIKIKKEDIEKCFKKYSGGPEGNLIKGLKLGLTETSFEDVTNINYYNMLDSHGNTFLHLAAISNYPTLVEYFIVKGTDINKQNCDGDTALHLAARYKNDDISNILIKNKAKLDIPNEDNEIPFEYFNLSQKEKFGIDKMNVENPKIVKVHT